MVQLRLFYLLDGAFLRKVAKFTKKFLSILNANSVKTYKFGLNSVKTYFQGYLYGISHRKQ